MKKRLTQIVPLIGTAVILSNNVVAQDAPEMDEPASPISGTLSFDVNTHFISYGADVWATGEDWDDPLFNPSFELNIAGTDRLKFIVGTWFDVNDNADTNIGDAIQEVDVWAGFSYSLEKVSFKLLYQEWMYASQVERIVDFVVAGNMFLSPSLTIHSRVDAGLGMKEGVVAVLGIAHALSAGDFSFSFPLNVAFATDEYHGGDGGYAFASIGANASLPLEFMPGSWTLNAGVTGYHTNDDVIPNNPEEAFVTGKLGFTLAF